MNIINKVFDSKRKFGVEFEVSEKFNRTQLGKIVYDFEAATLNRKVMIEGESINTYGASSKGWAESHKNDYWHIKYDSTCSTLGKVPGTPKVNGWEIASYIAKGSVDVSCISALAEYLHAKEVETNDNCGMHIHAEVVDLTIEQIGVLFSYWIAIEPILLQACPKNRRNNTYCKSIRKKFLLSTITSPKMLWDTVKVKNFYSHDNPEKKVTLNSLGISNYIANNNSGQRGTIELRIPPCCLNYQYVKNWIKLFLHFIEVVKDKEFLPYSMFRVTNSCERTLQLLGLESTDKDNLFMLDQELYETKVWFLEQLIKNTQWQKLAEQAEKKKNFITTL